MVSRLLVAPLVLITLLVAGCGGAEVPVAADTPQVVVTLTETATAPPAPAAVPPAQAATAAKVDDGVVPNVVGIDHQLAQDTMQSAGFYNLSEEDATGANRMLIIDRNWVVVEQIPAAGSKANADTTIILRSKKIGE
jgi:hypothetical protein